MKTKTITNTGKPSEYDNKLKETWCICLSGLDMCNCI